MQITSIDELKAALSEKNPDYIKILMNLKTVYGDKLANASTLKEEQQAKQWLQGLLNYKYGKGLFNKVAFFELILRAGELNSCFALFDLIQVMHADDEESLSNALIVLFVKLEQQDNSGGIRHHILANGINPPNEFFEKAKKEVPNLAKQVIEHITNLLEYSLAEREIKYQECRRACDPKTSLKKLCSTDEKGFALLTKKLDELQQGRSLAYRLKLIANKLAYDKKKYELEAIDEVLEAVNVKNEIIDAGIFSEGEQDHRHIEQLIQEHDDVVIVNYFKILNLLAQTDARQAYAAVKLLESKNISLCSLCMVHPNPGYVLLQLFSHELINPDNFRHHVTNYFKVNGEELKRAQEAFRHTIMEILYPNNSEVLVVFSQVEDKEDIRKARLGLLDNILNIKNDRHPMSLLMPEIGSENWCQLMGWRMELSDRDNLITYQTYIPLDPVKESNKFLEVYRQLPENTYKQVEEKTRCLQYFEEQHKDLPSQADFLFDLKNERLRLTEKQLARHVILLLRAVLEDACSKKRWDASITEEDIRNLTNYIRQYRFEKINNVFRMGNDNEFCINLLVDLLSILKDMINAGYMSKAKYMTFPVWGWTNTWKDNAITDFQDSKEANRLILELVQLGLFNDETGKQFRYGYSKLCTKLKDSICQAIIDKANEQDALAACQMLDTILTRKDDNLALLLDIKRNMDRPSFYAGWWFNLLKARLQFVNVPMDYFAMLNAHYKHLLAELRESNEGQSSKDNSEERFKNEVKQFIDFLVQDASTKIQRDALMHLLENLYPYSSKDSMYRSHTITELFAVRDFISLKNYGVPPAYKQWFLLFVNTALDEIIEEGTIQSVFLRIEEPFEDNDSKAKPRIWSKRAKMLTRAFPSFIEEDSIVQKFIAAIKTFGPGGKNEADSFFMANYLVHMTKYGKVWLDTVLQDKQAAIDIMQLFIKHNKYDWVLKLLACQFKCLANNKDIIAMVYELIQVGTFYNAKDEKSTQAAYESILYLKDAIVKHIIDTIKAPQALDAILTRDNIHVAQLFDTKRGDAPPSLFKASWRKLLEARQAVQEPIDYYNLFETRYNYQFSQRPEAESVIEFAKRKTVFAEAVLNYIDSLMQAKPTEVRRTELYTLFQCIAPRAQISEFGKLMNGVLAGATLVGWAKLFVEEFLQKIINAESVLDIVQPLPVDIYIDESSSNVVVNHELSIATSLAMEYIKDFTEEDEIRLRLEKVIDTFGVNGKNYAHPNILVTLMLAINQKNPAWMNYLLKDFNRAVLVADAFTRDGQSNSFDELLKTTEIKDLSKQMDFLDKLKSQAQECAEDDVDALVIFNEENIDNIVQLLQAHKYISTGLFGQKINSFYCSTIKTILEALLALATTNRLDSAKELLQKLVTKYGTSPDGLFNGLKNDAGVINVIYSLMQAGAFYNDNNQQATEEVYQACASLKDAICEHIVALTSVGNAGLTLDEQCQLLDDILTQKNVYIALLMNIKRGLLETSLFESNWLKLLEARQLISDIEHPTDYLAIFDAYYTDAVSKDPDTWALIRVGGFLKGMLDENHTGMTEKELYLMFMRVYAPHAAQQPLTAFALQMRTTYPRDSMLHEQWARLFVKEFMRQIIDGKDIRSLFITSVQQHQAEEAGCSSQAPVKAGEQEAWSVAALTFASTLYILKGNKELKQQFIQVFNSFKATGKNHAHANIWARYMLVLNAHTKQWTIPIFHDITLATTLIEVLIDNEDILGLSRLLMTALAERASSMLRLATAIKIAPNGILNVSFAEYVGARAPLEFTENLIDNLLITQRVPGAIDPMQIVTQLVLGMLRGDVAFERFTQLVERGDIFTEQTANYFKQNWLVYSDYLKEMPEATSSEVRTKTKLLKMAIDTTTGLGKVFEGADGVANDFKKLLSTLSVKATQLAEKQYAEVLFNQGRISEQSKADIEQRYEITL